MDLLEVKKGRGTSVKIQLRNPFPASCEGKDPSVFADRLGQAYESGGGDGMMEELKSILENEYNMPSWLATQMRARIFRAIAKGDINKAYENAGLILSNADKMTRVYGLSLNDLDLIDKFRDAADEGPKAVAALSKDHPGIEEIFTTQSLTATRDTSPEEEVTENPADNTPKPDAGQAEAEEPEGLPEATDELELPSWALSHAMKETTAGDPLVVGQTLLIGRDESCDLVIDHPTVSRIHAQAIVGEDGLLVTDLGSKNGTAVNLDILDPDGSPTLVRPGEQVLFGHVPLVLGAGPTIKPEPGGTKEGPESEFEVTLASGDVESLKPGQHLILGTGDVADIQVDGDEIRPVHALIIADEDGLRIYDLTRSSLTHVNDEPVDGARLEPGQLIALAGIPALSLSPQLGASVDHGDATEDASQPPPATESEMPDEAEGDRREFKLHLSNGKTLRIREGESLVVGRGSNVDVALSESSVSRKHLRIHADEDGIAIEDLASTNGTTVNGRAVKKTRLQEGDTLGIGPHAKATVGKGRIHPLELPSEMDRPESMDVDDETSTPESPASSIEDDPPGDLSQDFDSAPEQVAGDTVPEGVEELQDTQLSSHYRRLETYMELSDICYQAEGQISPEAMSNLREVVEHTVGPAEYDPDIRIQPRHAREIKTILNGVRLSDPSRSWVVREVLSVRNAPVVSADESGQDGPRTLRV